MKKTKILALFLVVGVMITGVGYAAWTDSFKVETTINTGEFKIELKPCVSFSTEVYDKAYDEDDPWRTPYENEHIIIAEPIIEKDSNKVTFNFKNLFPGTKSIVAFKAENIGTIPAAIQDIDVQVKTSADKDEKHDLEDAINVRYNFIIKNQGGKTEYISGKSPLKQLQSNLNDKLKGKILNPDCEITTYNDESGKIEDNFKFYIPKNSLKGDEGEEETVEITINFNFVQSNLYNPGK